jgi:nicotinamidase-related amidase
MAVQLQLPIVLTEQYPERLGATVPEIATVIAQGEDVPAPVAKMLFSACTESVQTRLRELQRPTILMCGNEAHVCVMQSALDLMEDGYQVFVPFDAISSRSESNKQIGWERMLRSGVVPTSTESAIFELLREAGTPDFKAMLALIK